MSRSRRNEAGMTGKRHRKLVKRAHIAVAMAAQDAWIEDALGLATEDRRTRDRLFAAARSIQEEKHNASR